MSTTTAATFLAGWLLAVGLIAVYFEVESVHCGVRIQKLLEEEAALVEEIRRAEIAYNEEISPDRLEEDLPAEFVRFDVPRPVETAPESPSVMTASRSP
ncbi:MAG: hypothetical protein JXA90_05205 [Planctomycetes bacterium]|nr:hypothetical protein [Planctomycetota bacterium]